MKYHETSNKPNKLIKPHYRGPLAVGLLHLALPPANASEDPQPSAPAWHSPNA